jgi:Skp family chaperone for outer membrane proteins
MDSGVEALGEVATGLALARAVEPETGDSRDAGQSCLNCRTRIVGRFCHECGQKGQVHRSLSAFGHDLLHGVFHFEGKIWRTLPMLAWRPGELTRRYIEGERARFVSPLALFLFSVFLMFAAISWLGGPFNSTVTHRMPAEERAAAEAEFHKDKAEHEANLREVEAELEQARAAGAPVSGIEAMIAGARREIESEEKAYQLERRLSVEKQARERRLAEAEAKNETAAMGSGSNLTWFDKAYRRAKEEPKLLLYKLQSNAYKFSWALIPISLPFVWLLFLHRSRYRRSYKAYDHIVFVTYSIAFMSLGFVGLTLLKPLGPSDAIAGLAIALVPPIHIYRQLCGAYALSWSSALWRTVVLLFFTVIAISIFLSLLLGLLG